MQIIACLYVSLVSLYLVMFLIVPYCVMIISLLRASKTLVDYIDDRIDSSIKVDLYLLSVGIGSLNKDILSYDESDPTLVDPNDDQDTKLILNSSKINLCPSSIDTHAVKESLDLNTIAWYLMIILRWDVLLGITSYLIMT